MSTMAKKRNKGGQAETTPFGMADVKWIGQSNCDAFFNLYENEAYRGVGHHAVLLPPHGEPVSKTPNSGGAVIEAYAHGLSYGDMMSVFIGYSAFFVAVIGLPLLLFILPAWMDEVGHGFGVGLSIVSTALMLFMLICATAMLRFDLIGYRYQPTLFDRRAGKVHIFKDKTRLFSWWPLWGGGGQYEIVTYDWSCVRGQVSRFRTFTGTVAQEHAALQCIVLATPGDTRVVGQFGLGLTSSALAVQPLLNTWEHIRRFMEHEGPLFVEGDGPNDSLFKLSFLSCLFFGQPFIGPGSRDHWQHPDFGAIVWQLFILPLWPLTALYGMIRWTSFHLKSKPAWPAEIIASVGGNALRGKDLDAWRGVVPEKGHGALDREPRKELT